MAEFTPNFNLKKPNEYEFYNIDDFNGNMDIIDKELKNAGQSEQLQSDVTEIKNDIGSPSDISSSPTIFGKLAEIKETLTTKFSEIISKITGIDSKIGTTTDTGGTSSEGGVFAKLNKLLTDWTTTRASRIDSIYSYTQTSTTSSSTGTLSQKLNYIKGLIGTSSDSGISSIFGKLNSIVVGSSEGNICYASDTERKSISHSSVPTDATISKTIATFIPDYSGSLRFYFYGSGPGDATDLYITTVDKDITYDEYNQGKAEALAKWSVSSLTGYSRTGDISVEKGKTYYIKVVSVYENKNAYIGSIKLKYDILERNIKGVKSIVGVQRGTFKYTTSNKTGIFPINPVNPFKTIVIANIHGYDNGSFFISNYKLTYNTLTLTSNGSSPHDIDWQLIEFV